MKLTGMEQKYLKRQLADIPGIIFFVLPYHQARELIIQDISKMVAFRSFQGESNMPNQQILTLTSR
ncbi:MAG: hypothetical protein DSZ23_02430 [Thermodesulfatator sp.]|nr:MAG: hypothetical protein DSZ23_02430 [Thermodesulfatator sp.]